MLWPVSLPMMKVNGPLKLMGNGYNGGLQTLVDMYTENNTMANDKNKGLTYKGSDREFDISKGKKRRFDLTKDSVNFKLNQNLY